MLQCPNCGQGFRYGQKVCIICKSDVSGEAGSPGKSLAGKSSTATPESIRDTSNNAAHINTGEQRKKWLEQQKALMNELTGLKSTLGDDIKLEPDENKPQDVPEAVSAAQQTESKNSPSVSPPPEASAPGPPPQVQQSTSNNDVDDFDIVPVENMLPEVDQSAPSTIGSAPSPRKGIKAPQNSAPKAITVKPEDVISVDKILEGAENIPVREYEDLAGAIDKVITHEKGFNNKKMPPSVPKPKPAPKASGKHGEIDYIIKYLVKSISAQPDKFNSEPITNLLNKTQQALEENKIDDALKFARNAKKAFTRMQYIYTDAELRLNALTKKHPGILNLEHRMNAQYRELMNAMKAGSYHRVNKMISDIEAHFITRPKPVVRRPPGSGQARTPPAVTGNIPVRTAPGKQVGPVQQTVQKPQAGSGIPVRAVPTRAVSVPRTLVPQPVPQKRAIRKKKLVKHD